MALRSQVVDFLWLYFFQKSIQVARIGYVSVMEVQFPVHDAWVLDIDVVDPPAVEGTAAPYDPMDFIPLFNQKLGKIGAVLAGNPCDECFFQCQPPYCKKRSLSRLLLADQIDEWFCRLVKREASTQRQGVVTEHPIVAQDSVDRFLDSCGFMVVKQEAGVPLLDKPETPNAGSNDGHSHREVEVHFSRRSGFIVEPTAHDIRIVEIVHAESNAVVREILAQVVILHVRL